MTDHRDEDSEPWIPTAVAPIDRPHMFVAEPVAGMVLPGEPGYDCEDCDLHIVRRAYPEGTRAVHRYCAEHGANGRPEDS